jgi:hypothetical protein
MPSGSSTSVIMYSAKSRPVDLFHQELEQVEARV